MKQKKSAKDIAFEKERAKYRSEIRKKADLIYALQKDIDDLKEIVREKDEIIRQKEEWIERLLEFIETPEENVKDFINFKETTKKMLSAFNIICEK